MERAYRRPLVASRRERDGSIAASLSPIEHAWSDNREYLIGALKDGWWLALEVDGQITMLASPSLPKKLLRGRRRRGGRPQVVPPRSLLGAVRNRSLTA